MFSKAVAEVGPFCILSENSFTPAPAAPSPERRPLHPDPVGRGSRRAVILREVWAWQEPRPTGRLDVPVSQNWTQVSNNPTLSRVKPVGRVTGTPRSATGTPGRVTGIVGIHTGIAGASTRTPGRLTGTPFTLA